MFPMSLSRSYMRVGLLSLMLASGAESFVPAASRSSSRVLVRRNSVAQDKPTFATETEYGQFDDDNNFAGGLIGSDVEAPFFDPLKLSEVRGHGSSSSSSSRQVVVVLLLLY